MILQGTYGEGVTSKVIKAANVKTKSKHKIFSV